LVVFRPDRRFNTLQQQQQNKKEGDKIRMNVLVSGGSGYLGQFLIERLLTLNKEINAVHYTCSSESSKLPENVHEQHKRRLVCHVCDFETGAGVEECVEKASKGEYLEGNKNLKLVVNCTALSQPKQCEENEEKARKINAPTHLCEALMRKYGKGSEERVPLLVHMSTDQVFCGSYSNTREDDAREKAFEPINAYGRSKKYAESYLLENYDKNALVILRSSVITGPQPPYRRVDRPLFLDFIAKTCPPNTRGQSAEGEEKEEVKDENAMEFWTDEFRNPVSRIDLTEAIVYCFEIFVGLRRKRDVSAFLFEEGGGSSDSTPIYHAGGPERLSRYDMVTIFCNTMRASKKRAKPAEKSKTTSSSAAAVVKTPADISMDSTKFMTVLRNGVQLKSFQEQVLDSTTVYLSAVLGKTR
tara:strand:+ start:227 stop:1468 length:1242 start_codon:yes stop_codon:yes gene_type:complete